MMNFKPHFFTAFIISALLLSCSSDDDTSNTVLSETDIEGTWELIAINSTPAIDVNDDGTTNANIMTQTTCFDAWTLDFETNGDFTAVTSEIVYDSNETPSLVCQSRTDTGTYVVSGNELSVTGTVEGNQETETVPFVLQNNILSFTGTESDVADYFSVPSGEVFSSITSLEFVYEKN